MHIYTAQKCTNARDVYSHLESEELVRAGEAGDVALAEEQQVGADLVARGPFVAPQRARLVANRADMQPRILLAVRPVLRTAETMARRSE